MAKAPAKKQPAAKKQSGRIDIQDARTRLRKLRGYSEEQVLSLNDDELYNALAVYGEGQADAGDAAEDAEASGEQAED